MESKKLSKLAAQFCFTSPHTAPTSIPSSNYSPSSRRFFANSPRILSRTARSPSKASARQSRGVSIKFLKPNVPHISQIQDMVNLNGKCSNVAFGSRMRPTDHQCIGSHFHCQNGSHDDIARFPGTEPRQSRHRGSIATRDRRCPSFRCAHRVGLPTSDAGARVLTLVQLADHSRSVPEIGTVAVVFCPPGSRKSHSVLACPMSRRHRPRSDMGDSSS